MHSNDCSSFVYMCTAFVFCDTTYGVQIADTNEQGWAELLNDMDLDKFFESLLSVNLAANYALALLIDPTQYSRMEKKMNASGFTMIATGPACMWHTTGRNPDLFGHSDKWIVIGYHYQAHVPVEPNGPEEQANPLDQEIHEVDPDTQAILFNDDQHLRGWTLEDSKIASQLGEMHCMRGAHVLVIGAVSRTDVLGFVQAGLDVTCVEKSMLQFAYLENMIVNATQDEIRREMVRLGTLSPASIVEGTSRVMLEGRDTSDEEEMSNKIQRTRATDVASKPQKPTFAKSSMDAVKVPSKGTVLCTLCGEESPEKDIKVCASDCCEAWVGTCCQALLLNCEDRCMPSPDLIDGSCKEVVCSMDCLERHATAWM